MENYKKCKTKWTIFNLNSTVLRIIKYIKNNFPVKGRGLFNIPKRFQYHINYFRAISFSMKVRFLSGDTATNDIFCVFKVFYSAIIMNKFLIMHRMLVLHLFDAFQYKNHWCMSVWSTSISLNTWDINGQRMAETHHTYLYKHHLNIKCKHKQPYTVRKCNTNEQVTSRWKWK